MRALLRFYSTERKYNYLRISKFLSILCVIKYEMNFVVTLG